MNKKPVLPKVLRTTMLLANLAAIVWLLLCKWASYYNPLGQPTYLSLLSFTCVFAFITNIAFALYWLFTSIKRRFLLSVITIILCWNVCAPQIGTNYFGKNAVVENEELGLKIMSWNVHMFDLGEWTKDKTSKARMLNLIQEQNPDILCLQEFYWDAQDDKEPYTKILQELGYPFVAFSVDNSMRKSVMTSSAAKNEVIKIGNAIFSKYPLRNSRTYPLHKQNNNMLSTDVYIDSNHIYSLNVVHLTSVGFGRKEMEYISDVRTKGNQVESKSKTLLNKLSNAAATRSILANRIDSLKREMDYPIIICGDFNDVPGSYSYQTVKGKLSDAFIAKGTGLGRTYRHIFATLRIDYILYDHEALKIEGYHRLPDQLSDHYPIMAAFRLKKM